MQPEDNWTFSLKNAHCKTSLEIIYMYPRRYFCCTFSRYNKYYTTTKTNTIQLLLRTRLLIGLPHQPRNKKWLDYCSSKIEFDSPTFEVHAQVILSATDCSWAWVIAPLLVVAAMMMAYSDVMSIARIASLENEPGRLIPYHIVLKD